MLKYTRSDRDPCGAKAASGRRKKALSPAEALTALEREGKRVVMQQLLGYPFPPGSRLAVCSQSSVRHSLSLLCCYSVPVFLEFYRWSRRPASVFAVAVSLSLCTSRTGRTVHLPSSLTG